MKVILLEDIDKVGKSGEAVNVSPGYARNYLVPRKLALLSTENAQKFYEQRRRSLERKADAKRAEMQTFASSIEGTELTAKVKVSDEGKLFGSVTSTEVARLLQVAKGIEIDKRKIELDEPIRTLGSYDIPIRLVSGVSATIKVNVVPEIEQS